LFFLNFENINGYDIYITTSTIAVCIIVFEKGVSNGKIAVINSTLLKKLYT
jgi:hypothetical protein